MLRSLIAAIAFTLATTTAISAQEITGRPADSVRLDKKSRKAYGLDLRKELNLTQEQSDRWDLVSKQARDKLGTLNDNTGSDKEKLKEQRKAILKEQENGLQEILTTEQKTKLKELRKARRAERKKQEKD